MPLHRILLTSKTFRTEYWPILVGIIAQMMYTHVYRITALIRRISGQSLGTFKQNFALSEVLVRKEL